MKIFDPFRDIDRTRAGAPYVVDETGWGWFAIGILTALPIIGIGCILKSVAVMIAAHPVSSILISILFSFAVGYIAYWRRGYRKCWIGCMATVIAFMTVVLTEMLYEIPVIVRDAASLGITVNTMLEWGCVTIFAVGLWVFMEKINLIRISPGRHMIMACIYFAVYMIIAVILMPEERKQAFHVAFILKIY